MSSQTFHVFRIAKRADGLAERNAATRPDSFSEGLAPLGHIGLGGAGYDGGVSLADNIPAVIFWNGFLAKGSTALLRVRRGAVKKIDRYSTDSIIAKPVPASALEVYRNGAWERV